MSVESTELQRVLDACGKVVPTEVGFEATVDGEDIRIQLKMMKEGRRWSISKRVCLGDMHEYLIDSYLERVILHMVREIERAT